MNAVLKLDHDLNGVPFYLILTTSLPMRGTALAIEHDGNHVGSAKVDRVNYVKTEYSIYLEFTFGSSLHLPDGNYKWQKLVG